jgi:hypothetical protein
MILGAGFTSFLTRIFLLVCGYQSFQSIETTSWKDDAHWLTFWLLYAIIQFIELFADLLLGSLPLYYELKLGVYVYLAFYGGATIVYEKVGKRAIKATELQIKNVSARPELQGVLATATDKKNKLQAQFVKSAPTAK